MTASEVVADGEVDNDDSESDEVVGEESEEVEEWEEPDSESSDDEPLEARRNRVAAARKQCGPGGHFRIIARAMLTVIVMEG